MVGDPIKKSAVLLGAVAIAFVACVVLWDILIAPPSAKAAETPEPEIVFVENVTTEYVRIPQPVTIEVPVLVEKIITQERPIVAQESAERWQGIHITPEEISLLAALAWREARGEKMLGMRLVVEVVLNRVLDEHFPDTVYDVLYQPGHFTPYDEALELEDITPGEEQYEAVRLALTETPILDPDVVFFAREPLYGETFLHVGGHYFTRYPDES